MTNQRTFVLPRENVDFHIFCDALTLIGHEWQVGVKMSTPSDHQFSEPGELYMTAVISWDFNHLNVWGV